MSFFDRLYSYEIIMLVLGSLLFIALLVSMIAMLIKGKSIASLIVFFVLSIVMIGFPAFKSIEVSEGGVKLEKDTHELLQNPTDKALRDRVASEVTNAVARPGQNPDDITTLASAQIALGDNLTAGKNVERALQIAPNHAGARKLKQRLELDRKLTSLVTQTEQDPNDQASRTQLNEIVREAGNMPIASPVTITNLARAQAVLGNSAKAQENLDKVLKIDPNYAPAINARRRLHVAP